MHPLIHARQATSAAIIGARFMAMVAMMAVVVLGLAYLSSLKVNALYGEGAGAAAAVNGIAVELDKLAFLKYALGWLLPSMLTAIAVGMLLTVITDTAIAIAVQGGWWFISLNKGMGSLEEAQYGLNLIPRHNSTEGAELFHSHIQQLLVNRLFYVGLALAMVAATMLIYEQKRKGRFQLYGAIQAALVRRRH